MTSVIAGACTLAPIAGAATTNLQRTWLWVGPLRQVRHAFWFLDVVKLPRRSLSVAAFEAVQERGLSSRLKLAFSRFRIQRSTRYCLVKHFTDRPGVERLSVRSRNGTVHALLLIYFPNWSNFSYSEVLGGTSHLTDTDSILIEPRPSSYCLAVSHNQTVPLH